MDTLLGQVPWFDQDLAHEFFVAKGVVALVATLLLVFHMAMTWGGVTTLGRQLRYFALLYASVLITYASVEQSAEAELVDYRHLGAMVLPLIIIVAMVVSIREDRKPTERNP